MDTGELVDAVEHVHQKLFVRWRHYWRGCPLKLFTLLHQAKGLILSDFSPEWPGFNNNIYEVIHNVVYNFKDHFNDC